MRNNKQPAMQVDGKKVTQKHHRSFYNGKCSSYRKKKGTVMSHGS
ncbi:hypothetical protein [Sharpea azabuensis]|nr:hypothetical protein [Sharpea azabuensis]MDD6512672.1 hypothetical protein [Sharpea azabuensis]